MNFFNKSKILHTTSTLIALSLLATACGPESRKNDRKPTEVPAPIVEPTPAPVNPGSTDIVPNIMPTPAPEVTPIPEVTPTPELTPTPDITPVPAPEITPAPTPEVPVLQPLPAARELTAAEKLQYLTNNDSFAKLPGADIGSRGTGFDIKRGGFVAPCMEPDANVAMGTYSRFSREEYSIQPLTSARQMNAALTYQGHPLYVGGRIDTSYADKIAVLAIAKKVRRIETLDSLVLRDDYKDVSPEMFAQRCGQMYKKGEVGGHVLYSLIWIRLNETQSKEAILSRLIDSKTIGTFANQQAFTESLRSLATQITDTDTINVSGIEGGGNLLGQPGLFGFDFSPQLKGWSDAADQVEHSKVPHIGDVFGNYPARSIPADDNSL